MPLANRVDPFGRLFATAARGTLMGNRGGRMHTPERTLRARHWVSRRWIACLLAFKDRHRTVWGDSYTELFFLDEVTALAAGHRPCAECRRNSFRAFLVATRAANADELDRRLHVERLGPPAEARIDTLPDGAMFAIGAETFARRAGGVLAWSQTGWREAGLAPHLNARVLTPATTLAALAAGFAPAWHPSAT